jgi:transcriptional regulator with XRE-family HTH domain
MVKNTLSRIKEYIDFKGLTMALFEKQVGMSNGSFSNQLKNHKTIGVDKLENIIATYPEINAVWLLTGKGAMTIEDNLLVNEAKDTFDLKKEIIAIKQMIVLIHDRAQKEILLETISSMHENNKEQPNPNTK